MSEPKASQEQFDALRSPDEMKEELAEQLRRAKREKEQQRRVSDDSGSEGAPLFSSDGDSESGGSLFSSIGNAISSVAGAIGGLFSSDSSASDGDSGSSDSGGSDGGGDGGGGGD